MELKAQAMIVHETTPQDLKNFCATQACGQPEDLVRLSEAALTTLKSLWNEIGYTDYECDNAKAEMFAEVKRVFETKLSSTQEVKCNLVSQVRLVGARVCTIELEVGEPSKIDELKAHDTLRACLTAHKEYLEVLEAKKAERAAILSSRAEELSALYYDLDDTLTTEQTKFLKVLSDFTLNRIEQFESRIQEMKKEKARLSSQNRSQKRETLIKEIQALWCELGMYTQSVTTDSTLSVGESDGDVQEEGVCEVDKKLLAVEEIKLTLENLNTLQVRLEELEKEKSGRKEKHRELMETLHALWGRTRAEEAEVEEFKKQHEGITRAILSSMESEIGRLEEVKRAMMKELIQEVRESIRQVWDEMRLTEDERKSFAPAQQEVFTEQALFVHEEYLAQSRDRLAAMQPIIKLVDRKAFIHQEDEAMKEALADPNRLLGRGRGMAEQLKKEEKVRNMVNKELPKLREKLKAAIVEFEEAYEIKFQLNGVRTLEELEEEEKTISKAKEEARAKKGGKAAVPQTSATPRGPSRAAGDGTPAEKSAPHSAISKLRSAVSSVVKAANKENESKQVPAEGQESKKNAEPASCIGKLDFSKIDQASGIADINGYQIQSRCQSQWHDSVGSWQ
ncbi:hypothetical protein GUITHDRAFT_142184 [Guillardia theta CCMP2712]|uniref:Protein regulator of cytokinesis 1 n=1 Tax=Guillardia theta (strain CCMP2712) TaxID=905079 RepID=L1IYF1_GUITC|nr:hypothetical protein GUITHDRAFT_142184 [Guillardia theta CCMP2712]EKX41278.1 hypothetical protein GUITHDRAFT_142184 [Guillardia theta CCMP2712]|eukprot:XP_005828258.1 hypothetical protein GUITHDRAFT_142184 [Guillardia theta CCMP2712]